MGKNSEAMIILTPYENRIINLLTEGYTLREIQDKIGGKHSSVTHAMERLKRVNGCRSSVQLVAKILREQLLSE